MLCIMTSSGKRRVFNNLPLFIMERNLSSNT
jgi:hypothetical protein